MQVVIDSTNVQTFTTLVYFDIYNRQVVFDTTPTTYNTGGFDNILGIAFSMIDQDGVTLASVDWDAPQIVPGGDKEYTLDLTNVGFPFLYQTYQIICYLKEANGNVYQTIPAYCKVCQPAGVTEGGYVPGLFQLTADCANNSLIVKELTLLVYNNQKPDSVEKDGTLYYPTGTISPVEFTGTPFTNDQIYTGQYRINCTTTATYAIGSDGFYVLVSYLTNNPFDVTCSDTMANVLCCVYDVQQTKQQNCNNALGERAAQQLDLITMPLLLGLLKELNGQDASQEAKYVRNQLNCGCGKNGTYQNDAPIQNELTPINPTVYNIVIQGFGGTTVPAATVNGNTKTYKIYSDTYVVAKGDLSDQAFSITPDTSVENVIKYKITFDYTVMAGYILTAIGSDDDLKAQFNGLVEATANVDLSNLNGKCVIDLSDINYFLSFLLPNNSSIVQNIIIGATTYAAPADLLVSNTSGIVSWLNGLGLGTFQASLSQSGNGYYINVLTTLNPNTVVSMKFTINGNDTTVNFQKTSHSLIAFLQAVVDYLCALTSYQVALGMQLSLCQFDYNGNIEVTSYDSSTSQASWNNSVSTAICNIVSRIDTLTGVTCAKIQDIFQSYPTAIFNVSSDSFYGNIDGNCTAMSASQAALGIIAAINANSDVKSAFCSINCTTPGTCPDVASINIGMVGDNIGVYAVVWTSTPQSNQTLTIKYRINGSTVWTVASNAVSAFPNGNLSPSPYQITGLVAGTTYDVQVINNCGGEGFITQITTPTGSVYSGDYLRNNVLYDLCGDTPVTLYSSAPFGTGVTMYTDIGLTTALTGYNYIASNSNGIIFDINSGTGVVGSPTGNTCSTGTAGDYILGNDTGTICAGTPQTLYTDGAFAVGGTLYYDSSLTTPVTGFSYVSSSNNIYNLNTVTGQIGSFTGLQCSSTMNVQVYNLTGLTLTNFVMKINGLNVPGLTAVTLNPTDTVNGTTNNQVVGSNTLTMTNSSNDMTLLSGDIKDQVTLVPLSCSISGNGTHSITVSSMILTSGNVTNGIYIRLT